MTLKKLFHLRETLRRKEKEAANSQEKTPAIVMTYRKTNVVANHRPDRGRSHDANQVELVRMAGSEVSADEQNRFPRHRQTGIFEHHAEKHGPVTVNQHVIFDEAQRVVKEIHYWQAARNVLGDSNWAVRDEQGWIRSRTRLR